ncbi:hypothetical protein ABB55_07895 [Prosthecomicrobium hirschii]|uniref:tRNA(Ile)-lysidine synthase n=1 Tax=Prosthecodimorpha hirschii TaxID=665126 RepID=A0A0P6VJH3_9HYPH|nr:tRNA lysidine(34) synthetase TilS [Prosthecomicrobium hirschii]KPL52158.1 hypothetical protein ABB55_07895 [Prosthecomicrobium hirschii]
MPSADGPLGRTEADRLFAPLAGFRRLAVAVSGGADSTALALLLAEWSARRPGAEPPVVLTVDHGLRADSGIEALAVLRLADRLSLPARSLVWRGDKPAANLQDAARRARYRLLLAAALRAGCDGLVTAHTLDDQAETLLLNLARGSGVHGLAAMPPIRRLGPVALLRPFLTVPKRRLVATLETRGLDWIEDPSNRSERFARVRMRSLLASAGAFGLSPERLALTAEHMAAAAGALDAATAAVLAEALIHPGGFARIARAALASAPDIIRLRALGSLVRHAGGAGPGPRAERLQALGASIAAGGALTRRTLGGALIRPDGDDLWFLRETGRSDRSPMPLVPTGAVLWDGRFAVGAPDGAALPLTVGDLGRADAKRIVAARGLDLPAFALDAVPAIRRGETLVGVPAVGMAEAADVAVVALPAGLSELVAAAPTDPDSAAILAAVLADPAGSRRRLDPFEAAVEPNVTIPSSDRTSEVRSTWLSPVHDLF